MERKFFEENNIKLVIEITDDGLVRLLHFSALPFDEENISKRCGTLGFKLVEVHCPGIDRPGERHGNKYIVTAPGWRLKFRELKDYRNENGRKLEIITFDEPTGLEVTSHFQFYDGISAARSWTTLLNSGSDEIGVEYLSSFALTGIEKEGDAPQDEKIRIGIPHNSWQRELSWKEYTLPQLGLDFVQPAVWQHSSKVAGATNAGNWSAKEYIPMGYLRNTQVNSTLFWQIENNGSWHWEISDQEGHLYLQLAGPSEIESHWYKVLKQGESFESVPAAVGSVIGGIDEAMDELTKYRRAIRRKNNDNDRLAVIFNDYMNCLWGDPTSEKEFPLVDAAAEAGCEYFCIDAGWYADGHWWDGVGEWQESKKRFPNGLKEVTDYIRSKGMIPGVWLEIEVMGIKCPLAEKLPDDWFFIRRGKRVFDRSRYQLDFRNPAVIAHADGIIDRLVNDYGVGYIKMDYNIEPGLGTEINSDSFGDGLMGHQRAYLKWLDNIFEKYPDLIIENCSSGGLRMDYAMLSRYSIQSTSDQDDYKKYCTISANAPSALCPEQAAVWSYPLHGCDREQTVFNMINAMLLRIHQSGHLGNIDEENKALVKEGIAAYKKIRGDIKEFLPFWPLGLSDYSDNYVCVGLKNAAQTCCYIAVWRREGANESITVPVKFFKDKQVKAECIYPSFSETEFEFSRNLSALTLSLKPFTARLFKISLD